MAKKTSGIKSQKKCRSKEVAIQKEPLTGTALLLYNALTAQESFSAMQREIRASGQYPETTDSRYTPVIGIWDGYAAPEVRFSDFAHARRRLREAALKEARERHSF